MDNYISDGRSVYMITRYGERVLVATTESESFADTIASALQDGEGDDDEYFCIEHGGWHSKDKDIADPTCYFDDDDDEPWAGPEVIPGTREELSGLTIRHNPDRRPDETHDYRRTCT
jgi:hypothetical protein